MHNADIPGYGNMADYHFKKMAKLSNISFRAVYDV